MWRKIALLSIGTLFVLGTGTPLVYAADTEAAEASLASATVNVYCTYKSGRKTYSSTGSGFFVSSKGIIMTNAHVAAPFLMTNTKGKSVSDCTIRTGSPAKSAYTARVLYISPEWIEENIPELKKGKPRGTGEGDFALLQVTGTKRGSLPLSFPQVALGTFSSAQVNDTLIAAGYPAEGKDFKGVQKKLEVMTATPTLSSVRYFVRPYADVLVVSPSDASASGVSGGPVAKTTGEVIGMTTAVETSSEKKDRSMRAITLSYVDRYMTAETGSSLSLMLIGDPNALYTKTATSLSPELIQDLSKALFRRK